ncbi:MAG: ABC transporter permease subunit [Candidatus Rokuibacteriota bacterium]
MPDRRVGDVHPVAGFALSHNTQYYYLFLAALALTLLASARLRHSRIGWAWQAIREDELAARAMRINTTVCSWCSGRRGC